MRDGESRPSPRFGWSACSNARSLRRARTRALARNIQGPSLIRVPGWVPDALGRYYLYFADHKGSYIRLAYADSLLGPWKVHPPRKPADRGLPLSQRATHDYRRGTRSRICPSCCDLWRQQAAAFATQGVHGSAHPPRRTCTLTHENQRIVMYFHGLEAAGRQVSRLALSRDGIDFKARPEVLGRTYLRAFEHDGLTYGIAMPGQVYRSKDGLSNFEQGPLLFNPNMRHCALLKRGNLLYVFWTQVGHAPERVLLSTIDLSVPWMEWKETGAEEVVRPEREWEGANEPIEPSIRSVAYDPVNQLRDPAIFEEGGRIFLLYAVAGESGIAIAELHFSD